MKFRGNSPVNPYEPTGQQGFPTLPNIPYGPGYAQSPGTIRDSLGSGLKASGIFQKDGKVNNMRGGFIGAKQSAYPGQTPNYWPSPGTAPPMSPQSQPDMGGQPNPGYFQPQLQGMPQGMGMSSRQLILQPAQAGIFGNGVATIAPDNSFLLVANLPPPQTFLGQGQVGQYAVYLVDGKGTMGFLAGVLNPVGNGVYRTHFQSHVPLLPYTRAVVSVEGSNLGQAPQGPIILKVKEPFGPLAIVTPIKGTASSVWGKISGLFGGKKKPPVSPQAYPAPPQPLPTAMPVQPAQTLQSVQLQPNQPMPSPHSLLAPDSPVNLGQPVLQDTMIPPINMTPPPSL